MARILVLYYSRSGHTRRMAQAVEEGSRREGAETSLEDVTACQPEIMLDYDGIVVGSPTYYGIVAGPVKDFFDRSVVFHGRLEGKVGGAFSSAGGFGGGSEVAVMSMVQMLLVHGLVIQGSSRGNHFGPVAAGAPDESALRECEELGSRVAALSQRLHG